MPCNTILVWTMNYSRTMVEQLVKRFVHVISFCIQTLPLSPLGPLSSLRQSVWFFLTNTRPSMVSCLGLICVRTELSVAVFPVAKYVICGANGQMNITRKGTKTQQETALWINRRFPKLAALAACCCRSTCSSCQVSLVDGCDIQLADCIEYNTVAYCLSLLNA